LRTEIEFGEEKNPKVRNGEITEKWAKHNSGKNGNLKIKVKVKVNFTVVTFVQMNLQEPCVLYTGQPLR
jgi:hypothetical protein